MDKDKAVRLAQTARKHFFWIVLFVVGLVMIPQSLRQVAPVESELHQRVRSGMEFVVAHQQEMTNAGEKPSEAEKALIAKLLMRGGTFRTNPYTGSAASAPSSNSVKSSK